MLPIQVWLPQLAATQGRGMVRRDRERAYAAWHGETSVWLLDDLRGERRWNEGLKGLLAIPSEHVDRVDIYHVGVGGYVSGPDAQDRFPRGRVDGLLETWLTFDQSQIRKLWTPETRLFARPRFEEGGVRYETQTLHWHPTNIFLFDALDNANRVARWAWPPRGRLTRTVSPDGESTEWFAPTAARDEGGMVAITARDPQLRGLPLSVQWPELFSRLMPVGEGADEIFAKAQMESLIERIYLAGDGVYRRAW